MQWINRPSYCWIWWAEIYDIRISKSWGNFIHCLGEHFPMKRPCPSCFHDNFNVVNLTLVLIGLMEQNFYVVRIQRAHNKASIINGSHSSFPLAKIDVFCCGLHQFSAATKLIVNCTSAGNSHTTFYWSCLEVLCEVLHALSVQFFNTNCSNVKSAFV